MFVIAAHGQSRGYQIENLGWWFSKGLVSGPLKLFNSYWGRQRVSVYVAYIDQCLLPNWSETSSRVGKLLNSCDRHNFLKSNFHLKPQMLSLATNTVGCFPWNDRLHSSSGYTSVNLGGKNGFPWKVCPVQLQLNCRRVWFFRERSASGIPPISPHGTFTRHTQGCAFNKVNRGPILDAILQRNRLFFTSVWWPDTRRRLL